jgi:integrase
MPKLTKSFVESLKAVDKPIVAWDQGSGNVSGFCVQVYPSGKKTYYYVYRTKGDRKKKRITLGTHGQTTCEKAREEAQRHAGHVAHRLDPLAKQEEEQKQKKAQDSKALLFKDFLPIFIEKHCQIYYKPKTLEIDAYRSRIHILPFFGDKKLQSITRQDILAFKDSLSDHHVTYNRCISFLSSAFNKAILWDYLPTGINPCNGVTKYKEKKKERFLDKDELQKLTNLLNIQQSLNADSAYVLGAIKMLIYTGCRKSEIFTLKWEDVQLDQSCIHLKDSKTGEKIVPLNDLSKSVLESIPRQPNNPYVFCGKKPGTHLTDVKKRWTKIRKMLGIEDVRMHDLRHTFASMAIKSGLGLYQVSKLLGHSNIQTTMRYAHIEKEELVKSAKVVESVFK